MAIDPLELTFESLEAHERERGPARKAAVDAGIDTSLIDYNLSLTPEQRLARHDAMLLLLHERLSSS